eukprot:6487784-Amphidinium_carterae.1
MRGGWVIQNKNRQGVALKAGSVAVVCQAKFSFHGLKLGRGGESRRHQSPACLLTQHCREGVLVVELWITIGKKVCFERSGVAPALVFALSLSAEEVEWAAKTKKTGEPSGSRCADCARAVTSAYRKAEWQDLMTKAQADPSFKDELLQVVKVYRGESKKSWPDENYQARTRSGYMIMDDFTFYSVSDFEKQFGEGV